MGKAQTKQGKRAALIALIVGVLAGAWNVRRNVHQDNDLMTRATLVIPARAWQTGGGFPTNAADANYRWTNNHEILHLEPDGPDASPVYTPVVLDTVRQGSPNRRAVALAAPGLPSSSVNPIALSPNGEWILCEVRRARPPRYFALALDGSKRRRDWPGPPYGAEKAAWFADSHRFMNVLFDASKSAYVARICSVDAPGIVETVRLPGVGRQGSVPVLALPSGRFIGRDPYLVYGLGGAGAARAATETLVEFGVERGAKRPRVFTVAASPVAGRVVSGLGSRLVSSSGGAATVYCERALYVSPAGDRVLWVDDILYDISAPLGGGVISRRLLPFLQRIPPHFLPHSLRPTPHLRQTYELATARLDGRGGVTKLGAITPPERRPVPGGFAFGQINDWAWTPDGKRISFTYDGALYTVPANAP